jgi:hypothetical protein
MNNSKRSFTTGNGTLHCWKPPDMDIRQPHHNSAPRTTPTHEQHQPTNPASRKKSARSHTFPIMSALRMRSANEEEDLKHPLDAFQRRGQTVNLLKRVIKGE